MLRTLLCFLVFTISFTALSQDIFDKPNTEKYSKHLMESAQYKAAVFELEKLVYFDANNESFKTDLLKAYRLSNQAKLGINKAFLMYTDTTNIAYEGAMEYTKLLIANNQWDDARKLWNANINIKKEDKAVLETTKLVFENNINQAKSLIKTYDFAEDQTLKDYKSILEKPLKQRSPGLAGILSTIVPGTGKIYAKDWKNGLMSLFFTASMSVQAYRNFNKFGINNYRPWIYTAIGSGFYLGNIYGSVRSAKNYNLKQNSIVQHEISDIFNAAY